MKPSLGFVGLLICLVLFSALPVHADTAEELKAKIDTQNQKLHELEAEIAKYETELLTIGKNKSTLQSEITRLDTSRKKLAADIGATQSKITSATLQLEELGTAISDKEARINNGRAAIGESLRTLGEIDNQTIMEHYLASEGLVEAWEDIDTLHTLQTRIQTELGALNTAKVELTVHAAEVASKKTELTSFKSELSGQKGVLDQNRKQQDTLLTQTKSKESEYQKILNQKKAAKEQLEAELRQYENSLAYTLDPASLPKAGSGVLLWPLDPAFMQRCQSRSSVFGNAFCITQYFGQTAFAKSGAYNGAGHNGVDFGAPEGTEVRAAMSGTVLATGNTDLSAGCYSYGKWVLVKHDNGLTTLYAHLSYISVSQGNEVSTSGLLGYSGKTGYATGPHLHFTLFASDGVRIVRLGDVKTKTNCANVSVPVAPTSAYLNPMLYL